MGRSDLDVAYLSPGLAPRRGRPAPGERRVRNWAIGGVRRLDPRCSNAWEEEAAPNLSRPQRTALTDIRSLRVRSGAESIGSHADDVRIQ
jgi:hypothetical protein